MELLRIVSMILVMVIHANTFLPSYLDKASIVASPFIAFSWHLIEALAVVCVNAFVMLSGWYGITFKMHRLLELLFTIYFISFIMMFAFPSGKGFVQDTIDIITLRQHGFFPSYILLYILSPALNIFANQAGKKAFLILLIAFFTAQTVFSFIDNYIWYFDGYSPMPYIGLYLLARYLRMYPGKLERLSAGTTFSVYFCFSVVLALGSLFLITRYNTGGRLYNYTNPVVIASTAFFVLFFSKLHFHSSIINWIGGSAVAALLIHFSPGFFNDYFGQVVQKLYHISPITFPGTALLFFMAILLTGCCADKIRKAIWDFCYRKFKKPDVAKTP